MKKRITIKAIIIKDNKLLLVRHVHPEKNYEWWAFPGGSVQNDETIFQCVEREVWEETGLEVKAENVKLFRQFIDHLDNQNNLEIFVTTYILDGIETIENIYGKGYEEHYIKELKYFSKEELKNILMLPKIPMDKLFSNNEEIEFLGVDYNEFEK